MLIDCPDQKGLVYKVTGILYRYDCNIISNNEFVDQETAHFFMRTTYDGNIDQTMLLSDMRAVLPENANVRLANTDHRSIIIFATKEHHCLGELLLRHAYGELGASICAIVSNHEVLMPLAAQ